MYSKIGGGGGSIGLQYNKDDKKKLYTFSEKLSYLLVFFYNKFFTM